MGKILNQKKPKNAYFFGKNVKSPSAGGSASRPPLGLWRLVALALSRDPALFPLLTTIKVNSDQKNFV